MESEEDSDGEVGVVTVGLGMDEETLSAHRGRVTGARG